MTSQDKYDLTLTTTIIIIIIIIMAILIVLFAGTPDLLDAIIYRVSDGYYDPALVIEEKL